MVPQSGTKCSFNLVQSMVEKAHTLYFVVRYGISTARDGTKIWHLWLLQRP